MPEEVETTEKKTSAKREMAATAASITVTLVLGVVATSVTNAIASRVHDKIANKNKKSEEDNN